MDKTEKTGFANRHRERNLWTGSQSFVKAEDGVTDLCIYHARRYDEIQGDSLYDPNRHAMIMKVNYDEKGFPVFSYDTMS